MPLTLLLSTVVLATAPAEPGPALRYFGFALVDGGVQDPSTPGKTRFFDEVAGFTNVAQMAVISETEDLRPRIAEANKHGIKAVLSIQPIIFNSRPDATSPSGNRLSLKPDALDRWRTFLAVNRKVLDSPAVAALYVVDEPFWNGLSARELDAAAAVLESDLPNVPTAIVEGPKALSLMEIPPSIDWIGFNRYGVRDPFRDPLYRAELAYLKAKRTRPDQRLILVPDTQWRPEHRQVGLQPTDMARVFESYARLAREERTVVAVLGYLWPGGFDAPDQIGARRLPQNAQNAFRRFGRSVLGPR